MAVSDWSTEPDANAIQPGINLQEGQAPGTINNSIRQIMADIRAMLDGGGGEPGEGPTYNFQAGDNLEVTVGGTPGVVLVTYATKFDEISEFMTTFLGSVNAAAARTALNLNRREFGNFVMAQITNLEVVMGYIPTIGFTIGANLASWRVWLSANPVGTWVLSVILNGSVIGTITIDTSGVQLLETVAGAAYPVLPGDRLFVRTANDTETVAADIDLLITGCGEY